MSVAAILGVAAVALGLYVRRWLWLAGRSRIGARSEDEVRRALAPLEAEGWRLRHSLPWHWPGDIDSVAIAPSGVAVVIETKTRTYDDRHLTVVQQQAAWLWRRRRKRCRRGATPVLCVVRAVRTQRWERGVLVVSIDALIPTLRGAAAHALRPMPRRRSGGGAPTSAAPFVPFR
jgi:hypothetical protein